MSTIVVPTVYFEHTGPENTARTLAVALERAEQLGIKTVLVASTSGEVGAKAVEVFDGYDLIVVSHCTGFRGPNTQELQPQYRRAIEARGVPILTAQHAFGGVNRAVRLKLGTYLTDEVIAYTLRTFGEGMKVCLEIGMMAADAGLVQVGRPCIAIAGTGHGADTALVISPANSHAFFDLRVLEILAKPHLYEAAQ